MTFREYQAYTEETAIYRDSISEIAEPGTAAHKMLCLFYAGIGLGEAGEAQNKVKKIVRDSKGVITDAAREAIKKELGGILWYVSQTATELDIDLDDVAETNIDQLMSRKERGVLQGSGDER